MMVSGVRLHTPGTGILVLFILLLLSGPARAEDTSVEAPRNPSSAKECALCHYRWIDTFFIDGRGSDLVPYQAEKVVASAEICFSCHDGSVVDSRDRVYNDRRHPVNRPPPPDMEIPSTFPLDENGFMQCATCHTAHGVPSEMGIEKTIFIRASNENSAMCRMCHSDKTGGPDRGNHPVDTTRLDISPELVRMGGVVGTEKNQVICETCHSVHGAANDKFLVDSASGGAHLCLDCHADKAGILGSSHDLRTTAPQSVNLKGKIPEESGVCGACHLVHGGSRVVLWGREMPDKSSGSTSQDFCLSCHREQGVAPKKLLSGFSHPLEVPLFDKGMQPELPVYDLRGQAVSLDRGVLTCATCHDPHRGTTQKTGARGKEHFLRQAVTPSPDLCRQCHPKEALVERTDHDLLASGKDLTNIQGASPPQSGPCGVCHLIHNSGNKELWALPLSASRRSPPSESVCLSCHNRRGIASKKVIRRYSHPVNIDPARRKISTTLPLYDRNDFRKDDKGIMTCLTCHDPHRWDHREKKVRFTAGMEGDARNSFLRLPASPSPILCGDCHKKKRYVEMTEHDMIVMAPASTNIKGQRPLESGTCGACHIVHNSRNKVRLWARKFGRGAGIMDRMCKSCHRRGDLAESKVPRVDSHPEGMLITNVGRNIEGKPNYFPLYDNRTGKKVTVGDIACASCHEVHQWDPRYDRIGAGVNVEGRATNSFLRKQTYSIMCIDCHGLDALFRFKYYHNSKQRGPDLNR
ncbi:cytochrome c3 family protein [Desulfolithobacter sp.]